ncbi:hypothetical protein [Tenggerimyces flavus]|uniref:Uncharacterized protein n=1 Tax=Tenggerimyces flavus TaxID=1708749 RepID=A0ABV7YCG4_9ACTN|nr:hypothetical protein [Tenggerimyces flavus]MBM7788874.1 hypothetical protein [Tenggerimyces flavus]
MTTKHEWCGSDRGYGRHRRQGEKACKPCREAHSIVASRLRTEMRAAARLEPTRPKTRRPTKTEREVTRLAALEKLAKIHITTFRYLLNEELHARGFLSTQGFKRRGGIV